MNNVPQWIKRIWELQPPPKCERASPECSGRMTKEHALTYAGKHIQELWAILDLCWFHHLGKGLDKRWNINKAMSKASEEDKKEYPRLKWKK